MDGQTKRASRPGRWLPDRRRNARGLEGLGEFFGESALRSAVHALTPHPAATRRFPGAARRTIAHRTLTLRSGSRRAARR